MRYNGVDVHQRKSMIKAAIISAAAGAFAALCAAWLPDKWLCDYGEPPAEKHDKAARKTRTGRVALFVLANTVTGMAFARQANGIGVTAFAILSGILLLLAWCDWRYCILPDELMLAAALFGAPIALQNGVVSALLGAGIGLLGSLAVFWLAGKLYHAEAMGMGDVKLFCLAGFLCGAQGLLAASVIAVFTAAAAFAVLLLAKRITRKSSQPFGPYLVLGIAAALALQHEWQHLFAWYLGLFRL